MASYDEFVSNASQYATNTGNAPYQYQFGDWITGKYRDGMAQNAQVGSERAYEQANLTQARAWEEYLDSTKYQRAVKDLEAAGLNPWLAVQSGISGSQSGSTTATGGTHNASSAKSTTKAGKDLKDGFLEMAGTAAKVIMMLALMA